MALFTCRVQFLNDTDPFATTVFPEPTRPLTFTFDEYLPLVDQLPDLHRVLKAPHELAQCGLQLSHTGSYLDVEESINDQKEEFEGYDRQKKNSVILRTKLSVRVTGILDKLRTSTGRDLRRALFSLKQLFQDDQDLVHEFISAGGLECLIQLGMLSDQNHRSYILRALGEIMLFMDGMNGIIEHNHAIQWLYSLLTMQYRLVVKSALKLLIVFVEYAETNSSLFVQALKREDNENGRDIGANMMNILADSEQDPEITTFVMTLINKTLNYIPDQDTFYDITDAFERQGIEAVSQRVCSKRSSDLDLVEQFKLYEYALKQEDGEADIPDNQKANLRKARRSLDVTNQRKSMRAGLKPTAEYSDAQKRLSLDSRTEMVPVENENGDAMASQRRRREKRRSRHSRGDLEEAMDPAPPQREPATEEDPKPPVYQRSGSPDDPGGSATFDDVEETDSGRGTASPDGGITTINERHEEYHETEMSPRTDDIDKLTSYRNQHPTLDALEPTNDISEDGHESYHHPEYNEVEEIKMEADHWGPSDYRTENGNVQESSHVPIADEGDLAGHFENDLEDLREYTTLQNPQEDVEMEEFIEEDQGVLLESVALKPHQDSDGSGGNGGFVTDEWNPPSNGVSYPAPESQEGRAESHLEEPEEVLSDHHQDIQEQELIIERSTQREFATEKEAPEYDDDDDVFEKSTPFSEPSDQIPQEEFKQPEEDNDVKPEFETDVSSNKIPNDAVSKDSTEGQTQSSDYRHETNSTEMPKVPEKNKEENRSQPDDKYEKMMAVLEMRRERRRQRRAQASRGNQEKDEQSVSSVTHETTPSKRDSPESSTSPILYNVPTIIIEPDKESIAEDKIRSRHHRRRRQRGSGDGSQGSLSGIDGLSGPDSMVSSTEEEEMKQSIEAMEYGRLSMQEEVQEKGETDRERWRRERREKHRQSRSQQNTTEQSSKTNREPKISLVDDTGPVEIQDEDDLMRMLRGDSATKAEIVPGTDDVMPTRRRLYSRRRMRGSGSLDISESLEDPASEGSENLSKVSSENTGEIVASSEEQEKLPERKSSEKTGVPKDHEGSRKSGRTEEEDILNLLRGGGALDEEPEENRREEASSRRLQKQDRVQSQDITTVDEESKAAQPPENYVTERVDRHTEVEISQQPKVKEPCNEQDVVESYEGGKSHQVQADDASRYNRSLDRRERRRRARTKAHPESLDGEEISSGLDDTTHIYETPESKLGADGASTPSRKSMQVTDEDEMLHLLRGGDLIQSGNENDKSKRRWQSTEVADEGHTKRESPISDGDQDNSRLGSSLQDDDRGKTQKSKDNQKVKATQENEEKPVVFNLSLKRKKPKTDVKKPSIKPEEEEELMFLLRGDGAQLTENDRKTAIKEEQQVSAVLPTRKTDRDRPKVSETSQSWNDLEESGVVSKAPKRTKEINKNETTVGEVDEPQEEVQVVSFKLRKKGEAQRRDSPKPKPSVSEEEDLMDLLRGGHSQVEVLKAEVNKPDISQSSSIVRVKNQSEMATPVAEVIKDKEHVGDVVVNGRNLLASVKGDDVFERDASVKVEEPRDHFSLRDRKETSEGTREGDLLNLLKGGDASDSSASGKSRSGSRKMEVSEDKHISSNDEGISQERQKGKGKKENPPEAVKEDDILTLLRGGDARNSLPDESLRNRLERKDKVDVSDENQARSRHKGMSQEKSAESVSHLEKGKGSRKPVPKEDDLLSLLKGGDKGNSGSSNSSDGGDKIKIPVDNNVSSADRGKSPERLAGKQDHKDKFEVPSKTRGIPSKGQNEDDLLSLLKGGDVSSGSDAASRNRPSRADERKDQPASSMDRGALPEKNNDTAVLHRKQEEEERFGSSEVKAKPREVSNEEDLLSLLKGGDKGKSSSDSQYQGKSQREAKREVPAKNKPASSRDEEMLGKRTVETDAQRSQEEVQENRESERERWRRERREKYRQSRLQESENKQHSPRANQETGTSLVDQKVPVEIKDGLHRRQDKINKTNEKPQHDERRGNLNKGIDSKRVESKPEESDILALLKGGDAGTTSLKEMGQRKLTDNNKCLKKDTEQQSLSQERAKKDVGKDISDRSSNITNRSRKFQENEKGTSSGKGASTSRDTTVKDAGQKTSDKSSDTRNRYARFQDNEVETSGGNETSRSKDIKPKGTGLDASSKSSDIRNRSRRFQDNKRETSPEKEPSITQDTKGKHLQQDNSDKLSSFGNRSKRFQDGEKETTHGKETSLTQDVKVKGTEQDTSDKSSNIRNRSKRFQDNEKESSGKDTSTSQDTRNNDAGKSTFGMSSNIRNRSMRFQESSGKPQEDENDLLSLLKGGDLASPAASGSQKGKGSDQFTIKRQEEMVNKTVGIEETTKRALEGAKTENTTDKNKARLTKDAINTEVKATGSTIIERNQREENKRKESNILESKAGEDKYKRKDHLQRKAEAEEECIKIPKAKDARNKLQESSASQCSATVKDDAKPQTTANDKKKKLIARIESLSNKAKDEPKVIKKDPYIPRFNQADVKEKFLNKAKEETKSHKDGIDKDITKQAEPKEKYLGIGQDEKKPTKKSNEQGNKQSNIKDKLLGKKGESSDESRFGHKSDQKASNHDRSKDAIKRLEKKDMNKSSDDKEIKVVAKLPNKSSTSKTLGLREKFMPPTQEGGSLPRNFKTGEAKKSDVSQRASKFESGTTKKNRGQKDNSKSLEELLDIAVAMKSLPRRRRHKEVDTVNDRAVDGYEDRPSKHVQSRESDHKRKSEERKKPDGRRPEESNRMPSKNKELSGRGQDPKKLLVPKDAGNKIRVKDNEAQRHSKEKGNRDTNENEMKAEDGRLSSNKFLKKKGLAECDERKARRDHSSRNKELSSDKEDREVKRKDLLDRWLKQKPKAEKSENKEVAMLAKRSIRSKLQAKTEKWSEEPKDDSRQKKNGAAEKKPQRLNSKYQSMIIDAPDAKQGSEKDRRQSKDRKVLAGEQEETRKSQDSHIDSSRVQEMYEDDLSEYTDEEDEYYDDESEEVDIPDLTLSYSDVYSDEEGSSLIFSFASDVDISGHSGRNDNASLSASARKPQHRLSASPSRKLTRPSEESSETLCFTDSDEDDETLLTLKESDVSLDQQIRQEVDDDDSVFLAGSFESLDMKSGSEVSSIGDRSEGMGHGYSYEDLEQGLMKTKSLPSNLDNCHRGGHIGYDPREGDRTSYTPPRRRKFVNQFDDSLVSQGESAESLMSGGTGVSAESGIEIDEKIREGLLELKEGLIDDGGMSDDQSDRDEEEERYLAEHYKRQRNSGLRPRNKNSSGSRKVKVPEVVIQEPTTPTEKHHHRRRSKKKDDSAFLDDANAPLSNAAVNAHESHTQSNGTQSPSALPDASDDDEGTKKLRHIPEEPQPRLNFFPPTPTAMERRRRRQPRDQSDHNKSSSNRVSDLMVDPTEETKTDISIKGNNVTFRKTPRARRVEETVVDETPINARPVTKPPVTDVRTEPAIDQPPAPLESAGNNITFGKTPEKRIKETVIDETPNTIPPVTVLSIDNGPVEATKTLEETPIDLPAITKVLNENHQYIKDDPTIKTSKSGEHNHKHLESEGGPPESDKILETAIDDQPIQKEPLENGEKKLPELSSLPNGDAIIDISSNNNKIDDKPQPSESVEKVNTVNERIEQLKQSSIDEVPQSPKDLNLENAGTVQLRQDQLEKQGSQDSSSGGEKCNVSELAKNLANLKANLNKAPVVAKPQEPAVEAPPPKKEETVSDWMTVLRKNKRKLEIKDWDFRDLTSKDDENIFAMTELDLGARGGGGIPPPPPLMGGIPPPPPPPPSMGGPPPPPPPPPMMGGPPPPPPLPHKNINNMNDGFKTYPPKGKKTIRLFWRQFQPVPENLLAKNKLDKTIWKSLMDVKLDTRKLETLFESRGKDFVPRKAADSQKKQFLTVLGSKRSNAINIGLTVLPQAETIKQAIIHMDSVVLSKENVERLLSMAPTDEEIAMIKDAQTESPDVPLGSAEDFLMMLASVGGLEARLKLWLFKIDYDGQEEEIAEHLADLKKGIEDLKKSKTFMYILASLRAVGNFLNGANVEGFHIEYLSKVSEVKDTSSSKQSLLFHLCSIIREQFPDSSDFFSEIGTIRRCAKVDFQELEDNLAKLELECNASWEHMELIYHKHNMTRDMFRKTREFLTDCAQKILILKVVHARVINRYQKLLLYLGMNATAAKEMKLTDFCTVVSDFALEYRTVRERLIEIEKKKEDHKKRNATRGKMITEKFLNKETGEDAKLKALLSTRGTAPGDETLESRTRARPTSNRRTQQPQSIEQAILETAEDEDQAALITMLVKTSKDSAVTRRPKRERARHSNRKSLRRTLKSGLTDAEKAALGLMPQSPTLKV